MIVTKTEFVYQVNAFAWKDSAGSLVKSKIVQIAAQIMEFVLIMEYANVKRVFLVCEFFFNIKI